MIENLITSLEHNHLQGKEITKDIRKIRIAIPEKNKGKNAGGRVIIYILEDPNNDCNISLLYIYDKSETESIDDNEIKTLLELRELELDIEDENER